MQPRIGEWNCYALGQAMVSLIGSVEETHEALSVYTPSFDSKMAELWNAKLGLGSTEPGDTKLVESLLTLLASNRVDFTLFFRRLSSLSLDNPSLDSNVRDLFLDRAAFDAWAINYRQRLTRESSVDAERKATMNIVNPKYVLRNYLAQIAIEKAQEKDFSEIEKLLTLLENPFDEHPDYQSYADLPPDWAADIEVSCSS
jgi:uncharacterized protein YdiU (UPF0061 family)